MLSDKDLATITNNLQTPLIVQDILDGAGELTNEVHLGLHEILSEDQPDSALLSIAISALKIANHYKNHYATMSVMAMECERIMVEYGPLWLKNAQKRNLDDNRVFETLVHIPEDLDSLTELLEITSVALEPHNPDISAICEIMIVQANAQALIAETFLESIDMLETQGEMAEVGDEAPWDLEKNIYDDEDIDMGTLVAAESAAKPSYTDNVIAFPGSIH